MTKPLAFRVIVPCSCGKHIAAISSSGNLSQAEPLANWLAPRVTRCCGAPRLVVDDQLLHIAIARSMPATAQFPNMGLVLHLERDLTGSCHKLWQPLRRQLEIQTVAFCRTAAKRRRDCEEAYTKLALSIAIYQDTAEQAGEA